MSRPISVSIKAVAYADVDALAKISSDSFDSDRHTQMKAQGRSPYNLEEETKKSLPHNLSSTNYACIKAVDNTGQVMGWSSFAFRGFRVEEIPQLDPGSQSTQKDEKDTPKRELSPKKEENQVSSDKGEDLLVRLGEMTNADMQKWMKILMPEGTKCMILVGIYVSPKFQSQGVGSALLKWGTDLADKCRVFIWVHSSEAAWKVYLRHGFEVVGTLDVDLDAWALGPPPKEEGDGAIWGHYVFRYMKRLPKPIGINT